MEIYEDNLCFDTDWREQMGVMLSSVFEQTKSQPAFRK